MKTRTSSGKGRRRTEGVNKAQLITEQLKVDINMSAKDVNTNIQKTHKDVSVAPAQVSNLRTKLKGKDGRRKGNRSCKGGSNCEVGSPITGDHLIQARVMADKIGGVARAKELLDILNKLR